MLIECLNKKVVNANTGYLQILLFQMEKTRAVPGVAVQHFKNRNRVRVREGMMVQITTLVFCMCPANRHVDLCI